MTPKTRLAVIGCGTISEVYFRTLQRFGLSVVACADLNPDAAARAAKRWGLEALSVEEVLGREDVGVIVNLTVPQAHAEVTLRALAAGKYVHLEKPLALSTTEGRRVVERAEALGLRVSCAPDTVLGAGLQTCRQLIDGGAIGRVVAGTAFMMCPGHEGWHPNPGFYYLEGGGPVFDMGPYYLTALVHLLGPVRRVSAVSAKAQRTRTVGSGPRKGETLPVEVPTHVSGTLEFDAGAVVTMVMSFDVHHHTNAPIELHGEAGSLQVPDPNTFGGPVRLRRPGADGWEEQELVPGYTDNARGVGAADLVAALAEGRPHRCGSDVAFHVLETMAALHDAAARGEHISLQSRCERPAPLTSGLEERL